MDARNKLGLGAVLAILGGLGLVIVPGLGLTSPELTVRDFVIGFAVGITCGIGAALALAGLVELRRERR
jgi:hypothetical protein